jgi:uroporphyrinogen-III synthase
MTAAASGSRPWLVTRPAAAGQALADALRAAAHDVRWLPAFDMGPAPDEPSARAALARLADVDLAVFVSPAAVRATHRLLGASAWPGSTAIGAVGSATADTVRALLARPDGVALTIIAPEPTAQGPALHAGDASIAVSAEQSVEAVEVVEAVEARSGPPGDLRSDDADAGSGSEAFWQAWQAHRAQQGEAGHPLRRVLLLRAAQGRDWLLDQLRGSGAQVDPVAVYSRRAQPWNAQDVAWVAARIGGPPPILVITSSEAVDALIDAASCALPAALPWLRRGRALALHPRIVERLHAAGFADAACVACTIDSLIAAT